MGGSHLRETNVRKARRAYQQQGNFVMALLVAFIVTIILGDLIAIGISYVVEQFSKPISLFVFLFLFAAMIPLAWRIAVRITEPKAAATTK